jgi:hypothetical protein
MNRKILLAVLTLVFALALTACGKDKKETDSKTIKVGANIVPHAEILEYVKPILKEKGYTLTVPSPTNQIFPVFSDAVVAALRADAAFEFWAKPDETHTAIRFVCSWATQPEQVDALASEGRLGEALVPLDAPLSHLPAVRVGERCRHAVLNGNPLRAAWLDQPAPEAEAVRVYLGDAFAGIGAPQPNGDVKFRAMLYRPGENG